MDKMIYIAANGAEQALLKQSMNAHNLANSTTIGFKKDLGTFKDLMIHGPGYDSRSVTQLQGLGTDLSAGTIISTGNELDMAVNGDGWIAVQARDGSEAYTRAGDLRVSPNGQLINGSGNPVIGNSGPIAVPPFQKLEIGSDGTITIQPLGETVQTLAVVDRIKLVNPEITQLQKGKDGLMRSVTGEQFFPDANVSLVSGALEQSNVRPMEAMINMIEMARSFEMQMKTMETANDLENTSTQLVRLGQ